MQDNDNVNLAHVFYYLFYTFQKFIPHDLHICCNIIFIYQKIYVSCALT
jgi:hypothetical protein